MQGGVLLVSSPTAAAGGSRTAGKIAAGSGASVGRGVDSSVDDGGGVVFRYVEKTGSEVPVDAIEKAIISHFSTSVQSAM